MRFLVDACAGHRLAEWLRDQGHDVVESRDRGPDPGDRLLLDWAADEERILVTMDKDFGRLLFLDKRAHCGLIRQSASPHNDARPVLRSSTRVSHRPPPAKLR